MTKERRLLNRFWSKTDKSGDCWVWTGILSNGYGIHGNGKMRYAHRWIWITLFGEIPEGLEIDHLCNNRSCVRPDHLEMVTHAENQRRAGERRPFCKWGHPKAENGPRCRACNRIRAQACRERKRQTQTDTPVT